MPIYEFDCRRHGTFERILPIQKSAQDRARCPQCKSYGRRVVSLAAIRPDDLWSGAMTDYGYQTSRSRLARTMKQRGLVTLGDRTDREGFDKLADDAKASKQKDFERRSQNYFLSSLGSSGASILGSD